MRKNRFYNTAASLLVTVGIGVPQAISAQEQPLWVVRDSSGYTGTYLGEQEFAISLQRQQTGDGFVYTFTAQNPDQTVTSTLRTSEAFTHWKLMKPLPEYAGTQHPFGDPYPDLVLFTLTPTQTSSVAYATLSAGSIDFTQPIFQGSGAPTGNP